MATIENVQLLLTFCVLRWPDLYGGHSEYFLTQPHTDTPFRMTELDRLKTATYAVVKGRSRHGSRGSLLYPTATNADRLAARVGLTRLS